MNRYPPKSRTALGGVILCLLLATTAAQAQAETLNAAFEKAWANSLQGRTQGALREEVAASRNVAESVFPGAAKVGMSQRSDRWNDNLGKQESEIELSVPLWLPGQKAARLRLAEADDEENERIRVVSRLAVAGELRAAMWALLLARSEAGSATERLDSVSKLEGDVARRVKVGEIAHADLLLVRQESATARAALADAQARVMRSTRRYQLLTGSDQLPDNPQETVSGNAPNDLHPRLAAGQAIAERARARMKLAGESLREAPSIGVQYRRDRDAFGANARDSVGFAISIPFAAEVRNAPLTASANTALIQADAQYHRLLAEIEAERVEAEAQLESTRAGVEQSALREQAAVERLTLIRRAFTLGETSLAELLRAESQATEARIERGRSRIRLSAAHANLNQARGITP